ncbi:MAG TPA: ankyrin repeat domain-containing protein [Pyrinomonadaceae bacterium]|nr:ankyrin repeat domain-containing protein [Pyrinomonadaceae bacterium]
MAVPRKLMVAPNGATRELWRIAESGEVDELERVLPQADINARNEHGMTALMRAAYHGRVQMVRLLLDHGADPNLTRNDNFTALSLAAFFGHAEIVEMLMRHGANADVATRFGTSPYQWAKARSFGDVARSLVKRNDEAREFGSSVVPTKPQSDTVLPAQPMVVRTLKDPPEIWDLVQEAPRNFDARSAFMARMGSTKGAVMIAFTLLVLVGAGAGAAFYLKDRLPSSSAPAPTATTTAISATTIPAPSAATTSTASAPSVTQPPASNNGATDTSPPTIENAAATPELGQSVPRRSRSLARVRPVSTDANYEQQTTETVAEPAPSAQKVESRVSADAEPKKPAPPQNQPAIAQPRSSPTKAKVIQWP